MPAPDVVWNHLRAQLPAAERDILLANAEYVHLPAGSTLVEAGQPATSVYCPESGLISVVSTMESGHRVEVAAIGQEGFVGAAVVLDVTRMPYWVVVQVDSSGYRIPAQRFPESRHVDPARWSTAVTLTGMYKTAQIRSVI